MYVIKIKSIIPITLGITSVNMYYTFSLIRAFTSEEYRNKTLLLPIDAYVKAKHVNKNKKVIVANI